MTTITAIETQLADHYTEKNLLSIIENALANIGKTPSTATLEDLAPVEEFHIGGRESSKHLLDPLGFSANHQLLDIGCGLGGTARFVAHEYGSRVTGIDLTAEFVETGTAINRWLGLQERVRLQQGSVMSLPMTGNSFDGAYMVHVGMNIADKAALFSEVARVLKPGAPLAIFDIMRIGVGDITFPVPWSPTAPASFVVAENEYRQALKDAGLTVELSCNRHDYALRFYQQMQAKQNAGPMPLGLHLLMGAGAETRLTNAYAAVIAGIIAPVEIIARK